MSHYCDLKRVAGDGGISTSSKIKAFLTFMLWFCLTTFVSVFSLVSIFVLAWMEVSSLSSCGNSRKKLLRPTFAGVFRRAAVREGWSSRRRRQRGDSGGCFAYTIRLP